VTDVCSTTKQHFWEKIVGTSEPKRCEKEEDLKTKRSCVADDDDDYGMNKENAAITYKSSFVVDSSI